MQTITLKKLKAAILKYHKRRLLIAQGPKTTDEYNNGQFRCAIATVFSIGTMKRLGKARDDISSPLSAFVRYDETTVPQLVAIQEAHNDWAAGKCDDRPLLAILEQIN